MGVVFAVFCLGLLPYMIFQLQLRVFYSLHDSKTPALIGLATMTVNIITNLLALAFLRHSANLVAGLGIGFGLANLLGSLLAWRILSIRMRGLDGYAVGQSLARMHVATLPAAAGRAPGRPSSSAPGRSSPRPATLILGGGGALVTYVLMARALHIRELATVSRTHHGQARPLTAGEARRGSDRHAWVVLGRLGKCKGFCMDSGEAPACCAGASRSRSGPVELAPVVRRRARPPLGERVDGRAQHQQDRQRGHHQRHLHRARARLCPEPCSRKYSDNG